MDEKLAWDVVKTIGEGAWGLVVSNQKLANLTQKKVNAVPNVQDWQSIAGARGPEEVPLSYEQSWYYTSEDTTRCHVRVYWMHSATYQGRGAYIPEAWVDVIDVDPTWWTFAPDNVLNVNVEAHGPYNAGTPEDPIAQLVMAVTFDERSAVGEQETRTHHVTIFGDGRPAQVS